MDKRTQVTFQPLARVVDRSALDRPVRPVARLAIQVPAEWIVTGSVLFVTTPRRLPCAHCGGGGCDACGRSGAFEAPGDSRGRTIQARLTARPGSAFVLRLPKPFGEGTAIELLLLEVHAGPSASAGVAQGATAMARAGRRQTWAVALALLAFVAVVALLVAR